MPRCKASMAKCVARDMATKVTTDAVHIFGGGDYMKDVPVQRFVRDAKIPDLRGHQPDPQADRCSTAAGGRSRKHVLRERI
jgi:alkylation response protein AidB-like acyl-CoA dehydrogenase